MKPKFTILSLATLALVALYTQIYGQQVNPSIIGGGAGAVSTVFGRSGAVGATSGDYSASQVTNAVANNASNTYSGGTQNFSGAAHVIPTLVGTAASKPATCTQGEMYFATDATAGQNWYYCTATNTWTAQAFTASGLTQLAQVTAAGSPATVTFSSISASYTNLVVTYVARTTAAVSTESLRLEINSDTTAADYSSTQYTLIAGSGAATNGNAAGNAIGSFLGNIPGSTAPASYPATGRISINSYTGTTYNKRWFLAGGHASSGVNDTLIQSTGTWISTAAITGLIFGLDNAHVFLNGSVFTLYGEL